MPNGRWIHGATTQGLPASAQVDGDRVVLVDVTYRARCHHGGFTTVTTNGFTDNYDGDFKRTGQRFADDWERGYGRPGLQRDRITARLTGEATNGTVRGSAEFRIDVEHRGQVLQTCESGPVGFALDLP
jgi:hypothetical protein